MAPMNLLAVTITTTTYQQPIAQNSSYTLFMDNGSWTQAEASNNSDRIVRLLENNTGADLSKERIAEINPSNHWSIPTTILVYNISIK